MCDTIVALGKSTDNGKVLFGKNSDRPPNEAQVVEYHPSADWDTEILKCTHIEIPQVKHTHAVVLSRPFWIWGAEMGANEYGVVIGNEAVFSKEEVPETGLLGMDLLRLGLERGKNAHESLDVITELLEKYGQGGVCELNGVLTYHNSFIIADGMEAWVLETSQRRWVAERVEDVRSISNGYTIESDWDLGSVDLVEFALEQGWAEDKESFSFARAYENEMMNYITGCTFRQSNTSEYLEHKKGKIDFIDIATILRSHPVDWRPWMYENPPICQHTSHQGRDSSAGSQISELGDDPIHWFTGSSNPCFSIHMPFTFRDPHIYKEWDIASEKFSENSFWWRRERVNRLLSKKNPDSMSDIHKYVENIQQTIYEQAHSMFDKDAFQQSLKDFEEFLKETAVKSQDDSEVSKDYLDYLAQINKEAEIDS